MATTNGDRGGGKQTPVKGRPPRLRGDARMKAAVEWRRDYDAGQSIRSIAQEHRYSYATTRTLLLLAGTTLRKRGGGLRRPHPRT